MLHLITAESDRSRRAPILGGYSYSTGGLQFNPPFETLNLPLSDAELYSLGIDSFLPFGGSNFKANVVPVASSNSVEKPVQEVSDSVPPQPRSTAVIPLQPPPAVPVNAAAANVPSTQGAVFLGSGSLGVINLGNGLWFDSSFDFNVLIFLFIGAFALGSGGIGYSDRRQQPRPSGTSPLFPPLAASPNLVPAATPSQPPNPIIPGNLSGQTAPIGGIQFNQPFLVPSPQPQPLKGS